VEAAKQEAEKEKAAIKYEEKINEAAAAEANFRQEEELQIDDEILLRVTILSDILSSDAFLLLPNEVNAQRKTLRF